MKTYLPKLKDKEMVLIFHPLYEDQACVPYLHNTPEFKEGKYLDVKDIKVINEYKAIVNF